jgi:hypothetical protein
MQMLQVSYITHHGVGCQQENSDQLHCWQLPGAAELGKRLLHAARRIYGAKHPTTIMRARSRSNRASCGESMTREC